ncbi:MAG: conjugal transfer protein TraF [Acidimicrobiia bacterium]|nr:conjugal transfer protein TraF [Acidimicrobiia bacterium]
MVHRAVSDGDPYRHHLRSGAMTVAFGKKQHAKATKVSTLREIDDLSATGKPVLVDFYQNGCAPCQVMDGIMNELAREYGSSVHVVKADITRMPDAQTRYKVRSTPTMVLLASAPPKKATKTRNGRTHAGGGRRVATQRWRGSGLVQKDFLAKMLESNGATRV